MQYFLLPALSLIIGMLVGSILTFSVPLVLAKYLSVAVLAALDSLLGGVKAVLNDTFDGVVLLSGFFTNALVAAALAFLGDKIGLDLYLAAIVAIGIRLFSNLGYIRRHVIDEMRNHSKHKHQAAQMSLQVVEQEPKDEQ